MKIGKIKIKLRSKEIKALKALIIVEIIGTALVAAVGYQVASKIAEMASTVSTVALVHSPWRRFLLGQKDEYMPQCFTPFIWGFT